MHRTPRRLFVDNWHQGMPWSDTQQLPDARHVFVFVHGLGATSNAWGPILPLLGTHLTATTSDPPVFLRGDLAGSGRSTSQRPLSMGTWIDDVWDLLNARTDPVHLIGHSLGSLIAQHAAARQPDRVSSLTLLGPLRAPTAAGRGAYNLRAGLARSAGMPAVADAVTTAALSASTHRNRPVAVALLRELLMGQRAEDYALSCEALANSHDADLSRVTAPVLLVRGKQDTVSTPETLDHIRDRLPGTPNVTNSTLRDCGHWPTLETPDTTVAVLTEFLDPLLHTPVTIPSRTPPGRRSSQAHAQRHERMSGGDERGVTRIATDSSP